MTDEIERMKTHITLNRVFIIILAVFVLMLLVNSANAQDTTQEGTLTIEPDSTHVDTSMVYIIRPINVEVKIPIRDWSLKEDAVDINIMSFEKVWHVRTWNYWSNYDILRSPYEDQLYDLDWNKITGWVFILGEDDFKAKIDTLRFHR